MLTKLKGRLHRQSRTKSALGKQEDIVDREGEDRIVVSNGTDLAVALRLSASKATKPLVIAKVQGTAAVELFLGNAERLYQRVYDHPTLARVMYDTVPLLHRVTDDVQNEIQRLSIRPKT